MAPLPVKPMVKVAVSTVKKLTSFPATVHIENEKDRAYIAGVWGVHPSEIPRKGVSAYEMMEKVHAQEIRALFLMGSNPILSNPNANFVEEGHPKVRFSCCGRYVYI